jgi:hypothetical protein
MYDGGGRCHMLVNLLTCGLEHPQLEMERQAYVEQYELQSVMAKYECCSDEHHSCHLPETSHMCCCTSRRALALRAIPRSLPGQHIDQRTACRRYRGPLLEATVDLEQRITHLITKTGGVHASLPRS